jgi:hypothetical protein
MPISFKNVFSLPHRNSSRYLPYPAKRKRANSKAQVRLLNVPCRFRNQCLEVCVSCSVTSVLKTFYALTFEPNTPCSLAGSRHVTPSEAEAYIWYRTACGGTVLCTDSNVRGCPFSCTGPVSFQTELQL